MPNSRLVLEHRYYVYMTFLSVGYGDVTAVINPLQSDEVTGSILAMAIGTTVFALFLSAVCEVVRQTVASNAYKDILVRMKEVLSINMVSIKVFESVQEHYIHHVENCSLEISESTIYQELPEHLQDVLSTQHFTTSGLLSQNMLNKFTQKYKGSLALIGCMLRRLKMKQGECVVSSKTCALELHTYLVIKGRVEFMKNDNVVFRSICHNCNTPAFQSNCGFDIHKEHKNDMAS